MCALYQKLVIIELSPKTTDKELNKVEEMLYYQRWCVLCSPSGIGELSKFKLCKSDNQALKVSQAADVVIYEIYNHWGEWSDDIFLVVLATEGLHL